MDTNEAVVVIMVVGMTLGIPLLGLTLRFSLKPLVEAFIRLREAQLGSTQLHALRDRVAEGWPPTRYEAKALREGRRPLYWSLTRRG